MRIIVMSDSHGNYNSIEKIIMRNTDAEWFFHLGDGERDVEQFKIEHYELAHKIIHVAGNCDTSSMSPNYFILPVYNHKIFATHGHRYAVKMGLERITEVALEYGCDIIMFGHTHVRLNKYENGIFYLNPGSTSVPHDGTKPSFANIDISDYGVIINIADV